MATMVQCPLCGKEIGKEICDSVSSSRLGPIGFYRHEYDYRKASHVYWNGVGREKSGTLCRRCAKQKFPEGKYYRVAFIYVRKKQYTLGGDNSDKFFTRANAEAKAARQNERCGGGYWVEEFKI